MLRIVFRLLALLCLAIALILAIIDISQSIGDSAIVMTPFGEVWLKIFPAGLEASKDFVTQYMGSVAWDPVMLKILLVPGWGIFAILWMLLTLLGRKSKSQF